jgi:hypothetical protein
MLDKALTRLLPAIGDKVTFKPTLFNEVLFYFFSSLAALREALCFIFFYKKKYCAISFFSRFAREEKRKRALNYTLEFDVS